MRHAKLRARHQKEPYKQHDVRIVGEGVKGQRNAEGGLAWLRIQLKPDANRRVEQANHNVSNVCPPRAAQRQNAENQKRQEHNPFHARLR